MAQKRVIEQPASEEVYNDDWFLKDSPTQETSKINLANLKAAILDGKNVAALPDDIAPEYNPNESYVAGDLAIHNSLLYICLGATTGNWDSTKWDLTSIAELLANLDLSANNISYDNTTSGLTATDVQGAIDEVNSNLSDYETANDALVNKIESVGTASGSIATFSDGSDNIPMKSLVAEIAPVQDLHGYDAPWVGGAGKNKLPMTVEGIKAVNTYHSWSGNSTTINNVTITIETDSVGNVTGIRFNGTASADITFNLATNINIPNGSYKWSNDQIVNVSNLWLSLTNPNVAITLSTQKEVNITVSNDSIGSAYIYASSGNVFNNIVFKPMIRLASVSDTTFAPYSNICPISGWDEANVTRCGKNLSKSQTNNSVLCSVKKGVTYTLSYEGNVGANIKKNTNSGEVVIWGPQLPLTFIADEDFNLFLNAWSANISNIQVEVGNQATTYEPYNGSTYTIDLDGTRYGGTLDVVSGVLTVDRAYVDLGDLNYILGGGGLVFYSSIPSRKTGTIQIISDSYKYIGNASDSTVRDGDDGVIATEANSEQIKIKDTRFDSASAIKQAMASHKIIYPLATPITIQLTPTQVKSLLEQNKVWADTGNILEAKYVRDLTSTINYILEQLNS
nr:MAG TPA: hypothetical protein [Caudoviricetes sp.]